MAMFPRWSWKTGFLLMALLAGLAATSALLLWLIRIGAVVYLAQVNQWLADTFIARMGYWGVFLLMAIESSVVPLPSEIVMPPAGDLARRLPEWSLAGLILMGTLGSLAGAVANYLVARYVGRMILLGLIGRYGRYLHVSLDAYLAAERFFFHHSAFAIFVGRLLPGVRHLISLPAGLSRMPLAKFCLLTTLGAGIWVAFLTLLGYWFGSNPELLAQAMREYSHWLVGAAVAGVAAYVVYAYVRRSRAAAQRVAPER
jgi:membrane protein DedA with SNARE-associated domain